MQSTDLARVVSLLDQIKEESEGMVRRGGYAAAIRISSYATEAQNILVGAPPTDRGDN